MNDLLVRMGLDPAFIHALQLDTLARLLLAALLGGVVGAEREASGKPAGLRTNLLICVGAALITELSAQIGARSNGDPGRLSAQIVSGIGFIGAGTILQARGKVQGLTTAATLWVVAAIGIAVGAGAYTEAAGTAALVLISLLGLRHLERFFARAWVKRRYRVVLTGPDRPLESLLEHLRGELELKVQVESIERRPEGLDVLLRMDGAAARHEGLLPRLAGRESVRRVMRA